MSNNYVKFKRYFLRFSIFLAGTIAAIILFLYVSVLMGFFGHIPAKGELLKIEHYQASEIFSSDDVLLGRYYVQNRSDYSLGKVPEYFIDALISTEDVRFYKHKGIDYRSYPRVLVKTILMGDRSAGGGSTITQQLSKNLYKRKDFAFLTLPANKIREMIIARRLEKVYEKDKILELYLNTVSFGENTYGLKTASQRFFNKKPAELNIQESALLVGMLKGPSLFNPRTSEGAARNRRNTVLAQMKKYDHLPPEMADSLQKLPIELDYVRISAHEGLAPYFRESLAKQIKDTLKEYSQDYNLYTDGLKIYTTIDSKHQKYAEDALKKRLKELQAEFYQHWPENTLWMEHSDVLDYAVRYSPRYKKMKKARIPESKIQDSFTRARKMSVYTLNGIKDTLMTPLDSIRHMQKILHAGLLSIDPYSGAVKAWVGGIDHRYFQYDHVLSKRQVGSVFKPLVYAKAIQEGASPCDFYENDSITYLEYKNWTPRNADGEYGGEYSLKGSLTHSVNTVSVKILLETGIADVIEFCREAGIQSKLPADPSLALGSASLSLHELIAAYTVFVNSGTPVNVYGIERIENSEGEIIYEHQPSVNKAVLSARQARLMTAILQSVVDSGTAAGVRRYRDMPRELAAKTGTTQDHADGWFIGFSPDLLTGVWVGADNPSIHFRTLEKGQGAYTALPVWAKYYSSVYGDQKLAMKLNKKFQPLSTGMKEELDCVNYRDKRPVQELIDKIFRPDKGIRKFFKKIFGKEKNEEE